MQPKTGTNGQRGTRRAFAQQQAFNSFLTSINNFNTLKMVLFPFDFCRNSICITYSKERRTGRCFNIYIITNVSFNYVSASTSWMRLSVSN